MNDGKKSKILWLILLSVVVILLLALGIFRYVQRRKERGATMAAGSSDNYRLSIARTIVSGLVERGLSEQEASFWAAVSAHETGGWTSGVWKDNSNPWGMKQPRQRNTTSAGEMGGYAIYNSLEDALDDLMLWMDARQFQREHDSLRKLTSDMKSKDYFEDDYLSYTNGCLKWYSNLFGNGSKKD